MNGLTDEQRQRIERQSQTLRERLESGPRSETEEKTSAIQEWADALSLEYEELRDNLQQGEVSLSEASAALRNPESREVDWMDHLSEMVHHVQSGLCEPTDVRDELPFESICRRIGIFTVDCLPQYARRQLAASAVAEFAAWVEDEVSSVLSHTLYVEFKKYLKSIRGSTAPVGDGSSTAIFDEFIAEIRRDFDEVVTEYSLLGRLLAVVTLNAIETVSVMTNRLEADTDKVAEQVADSENLSSVAEFSVVGDTQPGADSVVRLTFADGTRVGYKERGGGTIEQFREVVKWANQQCSVSVPEPPAVVDKGDYSWVKWVESAPSETESDVERYYLRAGGLVCLLYLTNTVDTHAGNMIAVGSSPTVIDMSSFAHPRLSSEHLFYRRNEERWKSVLRTGTLPHPEGSEDGDIPCFDRGGVKTRESKPQFVKQNTDAMEMSEPDTWTVQRRCLPERNGKRVAPTDYATQFIDGFESVYRNILEASTESKAELIDKITNHSAATEVSVRNRSIYHAIEATARRQSVQRSGLEFGLQMEALAAPMVDADVGSSTFSLFDAERRALRQIHLPRFTVETEGTAVRFEGENVLPESVEQSPTAVVEQEFESMSIQKCEHQIATIRECI